MRLEFTADFSNLNVLGNAGRGGRIDGAALADAATAAEAAGIDRVLIEDRSGSQDVAALASCVLHATSVLGVSIQHDAGSPPEIAARQIATLDQLSEENLLPGGTEQRGYRFTAVVNGNIGFTITATPIDRNKSGWPTLVVTESMQVTEQ